MSAAITLPYEDIGKYDGGMRYACPNEDTSTWREFLKGKRFDRAGGICSGGEVGLWAMLPSVQKELLLIDHSYKPLAYAMVKFMLIRKLGFTHAHKVLSGLRGWRDLDAHLGKEWWNKLPEKLRLPEFFTPNKSNFYDNPISKIRYHWQTELKGGRFPTSKLPLVRFLHGDFRDLDGQFDLFYASNALDGGNGNRYDVKSSALVGRVNELVKPGGFVLATSLAIPSKRRYERYYDYYAYKPDNWTEVERKGGSWNHVLYQVN